nr:hypothetical protein [Tanacetum cinerariifolium]
LEDNQGVIGARSGDDAPIKGRRIDEEEVATERLNSHIEEVRLDDGEVAKELEEQLARKDQKRAEQIARDAEIARIHAEEELQSMIE